MSLQDHSWQRSHWDKIRQAYSQAPYFSAIEGLIHEVYLEKKWETLSDLNQSVIKKIAKDYLNISTSFSDSRDFSSRGSGVERVLGLLDEVGGKEYLSGPAGLNYFSSNDFKERGIQLNIMSYEGYKEYEQLYTPFDHFVTILDVIANCGVEAKKYYKSTIGPYPCE